MTKASLLRKYLCESGFEIQDEKAVNDSGRIYTVMSVYYTGITSTPDFVFSEIGKLSDKNSLYWNYFDNKGEIQIGWALDDEIADRKK